MHVHSRNHDSLLSVVDRVAGVIDEKQRTPSERRCAWRKYAGQDELWIARAHAERFHEAGQVNGQPLFPELAKRKRSAAAV
jgi:hypothetical protein